MQITFPQKKDINHVIIDIEIIYKVITIKFISFLCYPHILVKYSRFQNLFVIFLGF